MTAVEPAQKAPAKPHRRGGERWTSDNPPEKIREFVEWYCHDRLHGQGYRHYAAARGMSTNTLALWVKDPRVIVLLEAGLQGTNAGPLKVQEVLDMLHSRAVNEQDIKAARTYLEAVGRMAPRRTEVNVTVTDTRGLSNEQLAVELRRAVALIEGQPAALAEVIEEAEVIEDSAET